MKNEVRVISVLLALATLGVAGGQGAIAEEQLPNSGEFIFDGDAIVLPLVQQEGQPMVVVDFGDGEKYKFIVDTGASVNVLDSRIAEEQGYEVIGEIEIGAPGGPQIPANIVTVPIARIGGASIKEAEFVVMDVDGFSRGMTQGVIGMGLFRDYLLTFDQSGGRITVARENLSTDDPAVMPYNDVSGHIQIDVDVAGTQVASHIDTGAMGSFMMPGDMTGSLPLQAAPTAGPKARLVGGERDIKMAQLDGAIQFAGFRYENPKIAFMNPSPGYGNIGSRVLGELVMSVDQKNHLIAFRKPAHKVAAVSDNKPRRLGVGFRGVPGGSTLTISTVDSGSLGEKAGFSSGDVLLQLNGKATEQYDMSELGTLFRSSAPLTFDIERDGVSKTIRIP